MAGRFQRGRVPHWNGQTKTSICLTGPPQALNSTGTGAAIGETLAVCDAGLRRTSCKAATVSSCSVRPNGRCGDKDECRVGQIQKAQPSRFRQLDLPIVQKEFDGFLPISGQCCGSKSRTQTSVDSNSHKRVIVPFPECRLEYGTFKAVACGRPGLALQGTHIQAAGRRPMT